MKCLRNGKDTNGWGRRAGGEEWGCVGCGAEDTAFTGIQVGGLGGFRQRWGRGSASLLAGSSGGRHTEDGAQGPGQRQGTSELATAPVQVKGAGGIGWDRKGEASVWALIWGREHLSAASDGVRGRGTVSSLMDYGFLMVVSSQLACPAIVISFHTLLPTPPSGQLLLVGAGRTAGDAGTEVGGGAQQQGHRRGCASLGRGSHYISLSAALPTIKPECLVLMASWGCRESTSLAHDPSPSPRACPPLLLQSALCLKLGLQPPPRVGREGGCDVVMPVSKMNVAFNAPSFSPYPSNLLDEPHGADGLEAWASASESCWSVLLGSVLHTTLVGLLIQSGQPPSLQATALVAGGPYAVALPVD